MEFGPEIKVDGKRPEWLKDDDTMEYRHVVDRPSGDMRPVQRHAVWSEGDWKCVTAIRLPANHPHYTTPTPDERAVAPELVERMIQHLRGMAAQYDAGHHHIDYAYAKDIVAALEPVDPDEAEAQLMCVEGGWEIDGNAYKLTLTAIKRGRQLEKEGK